jgi:hypothetical protein
MNREGAKAAKRSDLRVLRVFAVRSRWFGHIVSDAPPVEPCCFVAPPLYVRGDDYQR